MLGRILYLVFVFASIPCSVWGSVSAYPEINGRLKVISVNNGLPQQAATSMTQDRAGFLWIGTYDGLCRYDGHSFRVYHTVPGQEGTLTSNRILTTFEDGSGNIWIGTEGMPSLNLYDPARDCFVVPSGQLWNECRTIEKDASGRVWIGTANGLFTFIPPQQGLSGYSFTPEKVDVHGINPVNIKKIVRDSDGLMWVLAGQRIYCMTSQNNLVRSYYEPFIADATTIYADSSSNIFLLAPSGVYVKKKKSDAFARTNLPLIPTIMLQLETNRYLIGTEGQSVKLMSEKPNGRYQLSDLSFSGDSFFHFNLIRFFFLDRGGCLWIGSGHNGVAMIDLKPKPFGTVQMPVRESHHLIRSVLKDSRGRLWYGIKLGGIYMLDHTGLHSFDIEPRQNFNAIFEDRDENIWICTNNHVYVYREGRITDLTAFKGIPADVYTQIGAASAIFQDKNGIVWIGGTGKLLRLRGELPMIERCDYLDEAFTQDIFCMEYDPQSDRLWIGSRSRGVFLADLDGHSNVVRYEEFSFNNARLKSNQIWSLHMATGDGTLWVGSDNGLSGIRVEPADTTIINVTRSKKLASSKIMCVQEESNGCLWLNSSQGLLRYDPSGDYYREYHYSDGLCSNTATEAGFVDGDGTMYVGTIDGLNRFDPEKICDDSYIAMPVIVGMLVDNVPVSVFRDRDRNAPLVRDISVSDTVWINHRTNNFTFEFLSPTFRNPARMRYAYKLEGEDKQWNYTGSNNRTASYHRLRAGVYLFRVKAANSDGVWSGESREIVIRVVPAPWNTWWAYLLYFGAAVSIAYTILRYYTMQYKLKKDVQIEQIQREHERILHDAKLKFHTNISHEIRTSLALITAPLDDLMRLGEGAWKEDRLLIVKRNVDHLNALVQQFLDLRKIDKDAVPLLVEYCDLVKLVGNVCIRFNGIARSRGITLQLITENDSIFGLFDSDKIIKISSNLIFNALKFTPENGCITVFAGIDGDRVEIIVEDTGCGIAQEDSDKIFDRFYQAENGRHTGMGIGLSLVRRLAELHRGTVSVSSRPGEGSVFTVSLPFGEDDFSDAERIEKKDPPQDAECNFQPMKPTVMIVEDNQDMVSYLRLNMQEHYNIITDDHADSALEKARQHIPDLVLLDVMLRGGDGLEVCRNMKEDMLTNHIPVLIISARDTEDDIAAGYRKGAEDYILKPFSVELLLMKVGNIIKSRRKFISEMAREQPKSIERINPFMDKLLSVIGGNMHDPEFNITLICDRMATSRTQLYRKLKATTDRTISDLIRDQRMAKAHELIVSGLYNVSEVMYQVGIGSHSYFTKTFREYFGVVPSDMIRKIGAKQCLKPLEK